MIKGYSIALTKDFNPFSEPIFSLGGTKREFGKDKLYKRGIVTLSANKAEIRARLDEYIRSNGEIDGSKIINDWFPKVDSNVFISHSHSDEKLAIAFAQWLFENFGLKSFVDSTVWGYADNILKQIDDNFAYQKYSNTYIYEVRNRTTAFVHNMLSASLSNMMDKCECLFFLNTPNSIIPNPNKEEVSSPWIFFELQQSRILQPKSRIKSFSAGGILAEAREFKPTLPASTSHLTDLSEKQLLIWQKSVQRNNVMNEPLSSLDILYELSK